MNKKNLLGLAMLATLALTSCNNVTKQGCSSSAIPEPYQPEWSSLTRHQTPQWLMDMKFGIYCHWGPQSVQEERRDNPIGVVEAFDEWKADKFDAAEWAQLFKESGAQFAGPLAQHCTGCLNWDSEVSSWNSVNYGPKIDILGELSREIKKRDMKLLASFHTVTYGSLWGEISKKDRTYCEPIMEFDSIHRNDTRWLEGWRDRLAEATQKYGVDIMWFDTSFGGTIGGALRGYVDAGKLNSDGTPRTRVGTIHEAGQQQYIADFYNYAQEDGKEVEVVYKEYDIPQNIGMRDIENGNLDGVQYDPWMTDINMLELHPDYWSNWFYNPGCPIKDANFIVDMIVDVTSKNGRLLLSVPPKADGSFAQPIVDELKQIGAWLKVNGEGIYGSTPWGIYGEGPTFVKHPGHHGQTMARCKEMAHFTAKDIRYTTKGKDVYAFVLGKPEDGVARMATMGYENKLYPNEIKGVELLGSNEKIVWNHESDALVINFPAGVADQPAYCFKIIR